MSLMQRGFTRLFVNGQTIDLQSPDDYSRDDFKDVFVLVDRLTARPDVRQRLVDSLEICFQEGHGTALIQTADAEAKPLWFSERFECKYDHTVYATPEPRLFSFNNPTARVRRARVLETRSGSISISSFRIPVCR